MKNPDNGAIEGARIVDIFLLGPFLIYAGIVLRGDKAIRALLVGIGIMTIAFNGYNYLKYNAQKNA